MVVFKSEIKKPIIRKEYMKVKENGEKFSSGEYDREYNR